MKRPVRDERFFDHEGQPWQVLEVGKWRTETRPPTDEELERGKPRRPIPCGPYTVSFYRMVNSDGEERKLTPVEIADWTPDTDAQGNRIGDPLAGHRKPITESVRAGKGAFRFSGDSPVSKGERYHLPCGEIVIGKITTGANKRGERYAEVQFTNIDRDRLYYLRSTVPAARPDEMVKAPTAEDIERARIDGNYLTGAPEADGDPLPTVPPDWIDSGRAQREIDRREAQRELRASQNMRRQSRQIKAKLDEVNRMGEKGIDLTHELDDIIERLNDAMKDAA